MSWIVRSNSEHNAEHNIHLLKIYNKTKATVVYLKLCTISLIKIMSIVSRDIQLTQKHKVLACMSWPIKA